MRLKQDIMNLSLRANMLTREIYSVATVETVAYMKEQRGTFFDKYWSFHEMDKRLTLY